MRTYAEIAKNAPLTTEQVETLCNMVAALGNYTLEYAQVSVEWFVNVLGMGEYYYKTTPLHRMAGHLASIMAAEILGRIRGGESTDVHLVSETEEGAMYIILDDHKTAVDTERRIERRYPRARLQSYRTRGKSGNFHLRIYFVTTPQFDASQNDDLPEIERLGCREFITWSTPAMLEMCNEFFCESTGTFGPYIKTSEKSDSDEVRIMVALHGASNLGFFSAVSDVIDSYGLYSNRKFVEPLADGSWIYIFYISRHLVDDESFAMLRDDISRAYVLPRTELSPLFEQGQLAAQEAVYAYAALTFSNQFLSGYNDEYGRLSGALRENPQLLGVLSTLKTRLVKDTFTEERIRQTISDYPQFVKQLYADFARRHQPGGYAHEPETPVKAPLDPELVRRIRREVQNEVDRSILSFFGMFNRCVLKTNFYKTAKTSLAFRLDPMFLEAVEYPAAPHGIFMVLGGEFRAYHVRFRDVARGGIRIVRSNNLQDYLYNRNFIFEENYNLALTQQYKNKDIPEGGAKGTILLSIRHQDKADLCFKKYIDGLLDLMMPNGEMIDHYGREELLFLGPDEGTADLMEWAALRGRSRGYRFWKSFTTGKPPSLGGIPHDLYGMTTHSVHRYVLGILEKLGIDEASVTKVQTGGPDGDLGGNEIRISKDRTIAIVDGSGVLYDPAGIDREELLRLAKARQMVEHFARDRLGAEGFFVHID
ncbi:MAG: NAD-glutamate dehydrogenase, partial [Myxococcales bacterium]|nr:NAD-glutamate dehydrogenase [Myxococcales bacterium]